MEAREVIERVREEITSFRYEPPLQGLLGRPWSSEKVQRELSLLRQRLVFPHRRLFRDCDNPSRPHDAWLWVVAVDEYVIVFFDPEEDEFGLAMGTADQPPETINVRGDLVGVFMAR